MLIKRFTTTRNDENTVIYSYQVAYEKFIDFHCNNDRSIRTIILFDDSLPWNNDNWAQTYELKGLYYMENLTPADAGEIDLIDTEKLIRMVRFDEMEAAC